MGLLFQEHYPERMLRCFVINAPGFFNVLWRCVKTLSHSARETRDETLPSCCCVG